MKFIFTLASLFLLLPGFVSGQDDDIYRINDVLSNRKGFSLHSAFAFLQLRNGAMLIANQGSIELVTGSSVHSILYYPYLSYTNISETTVLTEDTLNNCVWVGTQNGIGKIDLDYFEPHRMPVQVRGEGSQLNSITEIDVRALHLTPQGGLLFGTTKGVYLCEKSDSTVLLLTKLPIGLDITVNAILNVADQWLIATDDGLLRLDEDLQPVEPLAAFQGRDPMMIKDLLYDSQENRLFIAIKGKGVFMMTLPALAGKLMPISRLEDANVLFQPAGKSNELWLGTEEDGIKVVRLQSPAEPYKVITGTERNQIKAIYQDLDNTIWIGTRGTGIKQIKVIRPIFEKYTFLPDIGYVHSEYNDSDPRHFIWGFFAKSSSDSIIYLLTEKGIARYNIQPNVKKEIGERICKDTAFWCSVYWKERNALLLGSSAGGILMLRLDSNHINRPDTDSLNVHIRKDSVKKLFVKGMYLDEDLQRLFIGTRKNGLICYDLIEQQIIPLVGTLPDSIRINSIVRGFGDELVLGTDIGLGRVVHRGKDTITAQLIHFERHRTDTAPPCILTVHTDHVARVYWLGTWFSGGLIKVNEDFTKSEEFTISNHPADNAMYGLLMDGNSNLWISTEAGISKFYPKTSVFESYDMADNLQYLDFNAGAFFQINGMLFFGGLKGFNILRYKDINAQINYRPFKIALQFSGWHRSDRHGYGKLQKKNLIISNTTSDILREVHINNEISSSSLFDLFRVEKNGDFVDAPDCQLLVCDFLDKFGGQYRYILNSDTTIVGRYQDTLSFPTISARKSIFLAKIDTLTVEVTDLSGGYPPESRLQVLVVNRPISMLGLPLGYWILMVFIAFFTGYAFFRNREKRIQERTELLEMVREELTKVSTWEQIRVIIREKISGNGNLKKIFNSNVLWLGLHNGFENAIRVMAAWEYGEEEEKPDIAFFLTESDRPAIWCWHRKFNQVWDGKGEIFTNNVAGYFQSQGITLPDTKHGKQAQSMIYQLLELEEEALGKRRRPIGVITIQSHNPNAYRSSLAERMVRLMAGQLAPTRSIQSRLLEDLGNSLVVAIDRIYKNVDKELIEAHLELFRSSIIGHFTKNAINTPRRLRTDELLFDDYLDTLSSLIRDQIEMTSPYIRIKDETIFLERYIEVFNITYKKNIAILFHYDLGSDLSKTLFEQSLIPAFFIQPFVENSAIHGKVSDLKIKVSFVKKSLASSSSTANEKEELDILQIIVEDNGIGLNKSKRINEERRKRRAAEAKNTFEVSKKKESMAIKIMYSRIALMNEKFESNPKSRFSLIFEDRSDIVPEDQGTIVKIEIPWKFLQNPVISEVGRNLG